MPRGKGTVYYGSCSDCGRRTDSVRVKKAKKAEFKPSDRYCPTCRKRTKLKLKEEKHSS